MLKSKRERPNLLTVARVGTVLVDLESGVTLGAYSSRAEARPRQREDDGIMDLPALVSDPKTKPNRKE